MSGEIPAVFGGRFLRGCGRRGGDSLQRALEGFLAVVGFKLACFVDELLTLGALVFDFSFCHREADQTGSLIDLLACREVQRVMLPSAIPASIVDFLSPCQASKR